MDQTIQNHYEMKFWIVCEYSTPWRRHAISLVDAHHQYGGGFAVQWRVGSMVEDIQHGGGYSIQICHIISREEAHHQYSGGLQYGGAG